MKPSLLNQHVCPECRSNQLILKGADHPQSLESVKSWFLHAGFEDIDVRPGLNGVVRSGRRPILATAEAEPVRQ